MNVISEIQRINDLELTKGITHTSASWHTKYKDSAWINIGNLPLNLTEGDVICIFSQYGEIDDVNLVRDKDSGKSRGFAFVKYEDARSCVLAVDNLCGGVVLGRSLRVDHVEKYRLPKHVQEREEERIKNGERDDESNGSEKRKNRVSVAEAGHAYKGQELASSYNIHAGQDLFAAPPKMGSDDQRVDLTDEKRNSNNGGGEASTIQHKDMDKAERRRRKEERAQKRREKEEYRRKKEERKRRKHHQDGGGHDRRRKEDKKRRRSRSDSD
jgi:RNA-binding motif X-linked protein 2